EWSSVAQPASAALYAHQPAARRGIGSDNESRLQHGRLAGSLGADIANRDTRLSLDVDAGGANKPVSAGKLSLDRCPPLPTRGINRVQRRLWMLQRLSANSRRTTE